MQTNVCQLISSNVKWTEKKEIENQFIFVFEISVVIGFFCDEMCICRMVSVK